MKYSFRNDYNQVGHPRIIEALLKNANVVNSGYGEDVVTKNLKNLLSESVGKEVNIHLLVGGTLANKTVISKMLRPYEAVISCDSGHINVHETGAVEATGHRIISIMKDNGKLSSYDIDEVMKVYNEVHRVHPKAVYISNSTEIGTVYTKKELVEIYACCKKYGLYLYLDGARLPIALTSKSNDITLKDIYDYTDVFYISGTKNGMPLGEILIIKDEDINEKFKYHLKNQGGMVSKTFTLSYMFLEYFKDDFYLTLAKNANDNAEYLRNKFKELNINIVYPNDTNQIFIELEKSVVEKISEDYDFEIWERLESTIIIRIVTTFNTTIESCNELISDLKKLIK